MKRETRIGLVVLLCCCTMWRPVGAGESAPGELDAALDEVKRGMLGLDHKMRLLSGQTRLEQVSIYLTVSGELSFLPEKVVLQLDGNTVAEYSLYRNRWLALKRGGAANLYSGMLLQGRHRLAATVAGSGSDGKPVRYREQWSLTQQPGQFSMVEIHLGNSTFSRAPAIDMRVVD